MSRIPTLFKTQTPSTQAHKPEEASHATIFSRGKGSSSKLFLSLKNLFFRTEKVPASMAIEKAVPQAGTQSIRTEKNMSVLKLTKNQEKHNDYQILRKSVRI